MSTFQVILYTNPIWGVLGFLIGQQCYHIKPEEETIQIQCRHRWLQCPLVFEKSE